jgi:hypothetical protein
LYTVQTPYLAVGELRGVDEFEFAVLALTKLTYWLKRQPALGPIVAARI